MPNVTNSRFGHAIALVLLLAILAGPAAASDGTITVGPSAHDVTGTLDRLQSALEAKGITVLARIDHAAGAEKAGLELAPTSLLVFGNPKLGTPLMQANRTIGLDLPMKALAWADADGKVWLSYTDPETLKARYEISEQDAIFATMGKALGNFTTKAIAAE